MRRIVLLCTMVALLSCVSSEAFAVSTTHGKSASSNLKELPSSVDAGWHIRAIAMGELVYARERVHWLLIYNYNERALQVIFSKLMDSDALQENAAELSKITGEVRFVDNGGNTVFMYRQTECEPVAIEAQQCRFLDLTSDLHAKLQAFPLFSKVSVLESLQNPAQSPP